MGHINIPIFIPHLGCPNQCVFCNQRHISGTVEFDESSVEHQIEEFLSFENHFDKEIAFFGGSFTGIDTNLMIRLLTLAQKYVDAGKVIGIRMSTRPDYISEEILDILEKFSISCVELGIQSINGEVLKASKRGHTVEQTKNAINLLKSRQIPFVGQMMIGLPKSQLEDELDCAKFICEMGASGCRIYPALVFKQTELEKLTLEKQYIPLTLEEAISRSAEVLEVFVKNGVNCLRIGLCESENLHSNDSFVAGPNHPSIGEMVKSKLYLKKIVEFIDHHFKNCKEILILCPKGATSQVIGNGRKNINYLKKIYGIKNVVVKENEELFAYEIKILNKED